MACPSGADPMTIEPWASTDDVANHLAVAEDLVCKWIDARIQPAQKIRRLRQTGVR
jgi:hypothetical protein